MFVEKAVTGEQLHLEMGANMCGKRIEGIVLRRKDVETLYNMVCKDHVLSARYLKTVLQAFAPAQGDKS